MFPPTHSNRKTKRGKRINPPNPQSSTQYLLQLHQVTLFPKSSADIPLDTTWAPGLGKPLIFGQPALLEWTFNGKQNVIDYAVIWDIRSWIQWQAFPVLHLQYQTSPAIIIHSFNLHSLLSTLQVIPATGVVKQNWKSYKKMTVKDKYQLGITSTWGIIRSQGFSAWSRYSGICQYTHSFFLFPYMSANGHCHNLWGKSAWQNSMHCWRKWWLFTKSLHLFCYSLFPKFHPFTFPYLQIPNKHLGKNHLGTTPGMKVTSHQGLTTPLTLLLFDNGELGFGQIFYTLQESTFVDEVVLCSRILLTAASINSRLLLTISLSMTDSWWSNRKTNGT